MAESLLNLSEENLVLIQCLTYRLHALGQPVNVVAVKLSEEVTTAFEALFLAGGSVGDHASCIRPSDA
jgi:CobQ-like glutamine amidotransferase family enzyme